jgi:hypothetical protein
MNQMRRIRLLRRHYPLLLKSLVLVCRFRLLLLVSPYLKIARLIRLDERNRTAHHPPILIAWAVRQSARIVPRASCLTQALAVQYLLARQGDRSLIRIGVAQEGDGALSAHAWVIKDDRVLIGGGLTELSKYSRIVDLEPSSA